MTEPTILYSLKLDLSLVNHIRSFRYKDHKFDQGFIEQIYSLLYFYQGTPEAELFDEWAHYQ